ncbi:MAG: hypothetical protein JWQ43_792, partial [Glaciihabitans sp.]|nr:hypothetical protein [Glaciihabitans sp.]
MSSPVFLRRKSARLGVGIAIASLAVVGLIIGVQLNGSTASAETLDPDVTSGWNPEQPEVTSTAFVSSGVGSITGVLTDESAAPLPNVGVVVFDANQNQAASGYTNADGSYLISGITPGSYRVQFADNIDGSDPYVSRWWHNTIGEDGMPHVEPVASANTFAAAGEVVVLADGTASDINAQLHLGASISGHVAHGGDSADDELSSVYVTAADGTWLGTAYTDGAGNYTFGGLDAGNYTVEFASGSPSHLSQAWNATSTATSGASDSAAMSFTLHAGEAKMGVNANLRESVAISGTVSGVDYSGSQRAQVVAMRLVATQYVRTDAVGPDAQGRYSFQGLEPGTYKVGVEEWTTSDGATTYATKWWNGSSTDPMSRTEIDAAAADAATSLEDASPIVLAAGATAESRDIVQSGSSNLMALGEAPTVTLLGEPIAGRTVTATFSKSWEPQPVMMDYSWERNGVALPDQHGMSYDVTPADVGTTVTVVVTGSKDGYGKEIITATTEVEAGTLSGADAKISGTAGVGQQLTAEAGGWTPEPVELAYQWLRGDKLISGAISATYTPVSGDAGSKLSVKVVGTKAGYTSATRTSTAVTVPKLLTASPNPTISGTTRVGTMLTADAGTWAPATVTLAYQWKRGGAAIAKATASTYSLVAADAGAKITLTVTGKKSGYGTEVRTSGPTATVLSVFTATPTPTVSGTAKVGSTLTAEPGTWAPAGITLKYQWKRGGSSISGATASTYAVVAADAGKKISVTVTGTKPGYASNYTTSAATSISNVLTITPTPKISGVAKVGAKLTATPGTWAPAGVTVKYQWKRGGTVIAKATASTYTPVAADAGRTITVTTTGSKPGYTSVSKTSSGSLVAKVLTATPTPKITGTAKVGSTLAVTAGSWKPATVTLKYAWLRNGTAISGATSSKYKLVAADKGKTVTVKVTGSKSGYTSVAKTSAAVKPG